MSTDTNRDVHAAEAQPATETENEKTGFTAGPYLRRTRDVLTAQFKEATKVQADTRSALWAVWQDLQGDLKSQFTSFEQNAKRQTESLLQRLPFKRPQKAPAEAESTESAEQQS